MLTAQRLRHFLSYDPDTGVFTWVRHHKRTDVIGKKAGCKSNGYLIIRIDQHNYMAHRLAWFYMTGEWPEDQIDHRNLVRSDNRWSNLRAANNGQNMQNIHAHSDSLTGVKGVTMDHRNGRYNAKIMVDRQSYYLGGFDTADEAGAAYVEAAKRLHGEFART